ncbi:MAG: cell division ATP-binding protein FtsE [Ignavibacteriaceae bacterium]|nr:cell division ATP-binding protein FtsE [Ignavibacteriaceae bacterium]HRI48439.1 cell division ATP-binding protein FtsE [Ignavibacteriaceae bacterium]
MLEFNNVCYSYDKTPILEDVSFKVKHGELVFLIGKSGSGKSTLLKLIYMDLLADSGFVEFEEFNSESLDRKAIPFLRRKVGIIFQEFRLLKKRTVYENLSFILEVINVPSKEIRRKVNDVLGEVGLIHRRNSYPDELSGGEQQRIAIARAIINQPILLLADEPTGNLDPETSIEIMDLLKRINSKGTAIIIATHNYDLVKKYPTRIIKIEKGKTISAQLKQQS